MCLVIELSFVCIQQKCDVIEVENDDVLIEENSIDVKNDEDLPAACSVIELVSKVSFVLRWCF
jgi:hypothetical protein